jgi:ATP-dependent DNA helicase RecQ
LNHVVEVLTGANTDRIRQHRHDQLTTYGIGKDLPRPEWQAIGRELIRLGFLRQNAERMNILELTEEGRAALKNRATIQLTKTTVLKKPAKLTGDVECDEELFEELRKVRRATADERGVPPYVIFSDAALRHMARQYPTGHAEFAQVPGVGSQKLGEFAGAFTAIVRDYLATHSRKQFAGNVPAREARPAPRVTDTIRETLRLFRSGQTPAQIATARGMVEGTIFSHLATAIEAGEHIDISYLVSPADEKAIRGALERFPEGAISPAKEALGPNFTYGQIRLVAASMSRHLAPNQDSAPTP